MAAEQIEFDSVELTPDTQAYVIAIAGIAIEPNRYILTNFSNEQSRLEEAERVIEAYVREERRRVGSDAIDYAIFDDDVEGMGLVSRKSVQRLINVGGLTLKKLHKDFEILGAELSPEEYAILDMRLSPPPERN
jgi:hypothetical protein